MYVETLKDGETQTESTGTDFLDSIYDGISTYTDKALDKAVDYGESKASEYVDSQVNKLLYGDAPTPSSNTNTNTNTSNNGQVGGTFFSTYGLTEDQAKALISTLTQDKWKTMTDADKQKVRTIASVLNVALPSFTNATNDTPIYKNQYAPAVVSSIATGLTYYFNKGWLIPLLVGGGVYFAYDKFLVKDLKK